jgi:RND family efflux transporter MFP subunit
VLADVPEARLWEIADGAKATVTVAASQADPIPGVVAHIFPQVDPTTRTARVRVEIRNEKTALRPGMFATVEITTGTPEGVVAVPESAVQTIEGGPAVFVPHEKEESTFVKRQVGVGPAVKGFVPVFAGLKEGEKYVASGSFILKAEIGKEGAAHEH